MKTSKRLVQKTASLSVWCGCELVNVLRGDLTGMSQAKDVLVSFFDIVFFNFEALGPAVFKLHYSFMEGGQTWSLQTLLISMDDFITLKMATMWAK